MGTTFAVICLSLRSADEDDAPFSGSRGRLRSTTMFVMFIMIVIIVSRFGPSREKKHEVILVTARVGRLTSVRLEVRPL